MDSAPAFFTLVCPGDVIPDFETHPKPASIACQQSMKPNDKKSASSSRNKIRNLA